MGGIVSSLVSQGRPQIGADPSRIERDAAHPFGAFVTLHVQGGSPLYTIRDLRFRCVISLRVNGNTRVEMPEVNGSVDPETLNTLKDGQSVQCAAPLDVDVSSENRIRGAFQLCATYRYALPLLSVFGQGQQTKVLLFTSQNDTPSKPIWLRDPAHEPAVCPEPNVTIRYRPPRRPS